MSSDLPAEVKPLVNEFLFNVLELCVSLLPNDIIDIPIIVAKIFVPSQPYYSKSPTKDINMDKLKRVRSFKLIKQEYQESLNNEENIRVDNKFKVWCRIPVLIHILTR
jgi:hypothetical protein